MIDEFPRHTMNYDDTGDGIMVTCSECDYAVEIGADGITVHDMGDKSVVHSYSIKGLRSSSGNMHMTEKVPGVFERLFRILGIR